MVARTLWNLLNKASPKVEKGNESSSKVKEMFEIREPGWKKMPTTSLFRATNFELYVKPHLGAMILGGVLFLGCVGAIVYMRLTTEEGTYTTMTENGTFVQRPRKSKWD